jgi:hypothetical protein
LQKAKDSPTTPGSIQRVDGTRLVAKVHRSLLKGRKGIFVISAIDCRHGQPLKKIRPNGRSFDEAFARQCFGKVTDRCAVVQFRISSGRGFYLPLTNALSQTIHSISVDGFHFHTKHLLFLGHANVFQSHFENLSLNDFLWGTKKVKKTAIVYVEENCTRVVPCSSLQSLLKPTEDYDLDVMITESGHFIVGPEQIFPKIYQKVHRPCYPLGYPILRP